jgi:GNAT superfamily N-acetyltransferase
VKLRARRLTGRQVLLMMEDYFDAMGKPAMEMAFGWREPSDAVYSSEYNSSVRYWEFRDDDLTPPRRVAWAKMHLSMIDPHDDEAVISRGVWPEFQHAGYGKAIISWLANRAKRLGASHLSRCVNRDNAAVYARSVAEAMRPDSPWMWTGDQWYPGNGYSWFMLPLDEKFRPREKPRPPAIVGFWRRPPSEQDEEMFTPRPGVEISRSRLHRT